MERNTVGVVNKKWFSILRICYFAQQLAVMWDGIYALQEASTAQLELRG